MRAAGYFDHRLPEVFAGCDEQLTHPKVDGLGCEPHLPERFGDVALYGVPGRWGRTDVLADARSPAAAA